MNEIVNKIYEAYLKPRDKEYQISKNESKLIVKEVMFKNSLNIDQIKNFEEYLFISKQVEHENNENLIQFVIEYLNTKK